MSIQRPGFTALIQLATEARGEEWGEGLNSAVAAAIFAGWTWERIFLTCARLIVDEDATPRDLLNEVSPWRHTGDDAAVPPTDDWAEARAAMSERKPEPGEGAA